MSSFDPLALWFLLTVAGSAVRNYGRAVFSLNPTFLVKGGYLAGSGAKYSVYALYHLIGAIPKIGRNIVSGREWPTFGFLVALMTNLVLSLLGFLANGIILVGPPYLLWELFLAADPIVLPHGLVFGFRTLLDMAITVFSLVFSTVILLFFVEEFTPGHNRVFELADLCQKSETTGSSERQTAHTSQQLLNEDQVESKLSDIERQLENNK